MLLNDRWHAEVDQQRPCRAMEFLAAAITGRQSQDMTSQLLNHIIQRIRGCADRLASAVTGIDLSLFHQVFHEEADANIDNLGQMPLHINRLQGSDEDLKAILCCAHSAKGDAATFGFAGVAELTHEMRSAPISLSDTNFWALIFQPGFSTAEAITDVPEHGVGMDLVKRSITALDDTVEIELLGGQGMTVEMGLPLTLVIMDNMSVGTAAEC